MRVHFLFAAMLLASAMAGGAQAQKLAGPDWLSRPDGRQVAEAYPELALLLSIEGRVVVSCPVTSEGRLRDCVVTSVSPAGLGFDAAALKLTTFFQMTPLIINNRPREGGSVRIPIRFILPDVPRPPTSEAADPGAQAIPPANAALAARLKPLLTRDLLALQNIQADDALEQARTEVDAETHAVAAAALHGAIATTAPEWANAMTKAYASAMDEAGLEALIDFETSPSGAEPRLSLANLELDRIFNGAVAEIQVNGRAGFCARVQCSPEPWEKPAGVKLVNPAWARQPDEGMLAAAMPPFASLLGLPGWAQLNCIAGADGGLKACVAARESPDGLDLGRAAMALSEAYAISPEQLGDGAAGEAVAVLIRFPEPYQFSPPDTHGIAPKRFSPTPTSRAVARQIVADHKTLGEMRDIAANFPNRMRDDASPSQRAALSAIMEAFSNGLAKAADSATDVYAAAYSTEELETILAWKRSPAGRVAERVGAAELKGLRQTYRQQVLTDARKRFCAQRACEIETPPGP